MIIDHVVVRSPAHAALVADLVRQTDLPALDGFSHEGALLSRGVRFANGPFFDIFDWPADRASYAPLVAIADSVTRIGSICAAQNWAHVIHRGEDEPADNRQPWSTLSFRRGQGVVSSLFVIEYEPYPPGPDYRGALYDRTRTHSGATFERVVLGAGDVAKARADLSKLGWTAAELEIENGSEGVARVDFRRGETTASVIPGRA